MAPASAFASVPTRSMRVAGSPCSSQPKRTASSPSDSDMGSLPGALRFGTTRYLDGGLAGVAGGAAGLAAAEPPLACSAERTAGVMSEADAL